MSISKFETEAQQILNKAAAPDADAAVIKEVIPDESGTGRKRGPYKKRDKNGNVKKGGTKEKIDPAIYEQSAKAINTIVFSVTCGVCGTSDAWPEADRAKAMDLAAARYMETKNYVMPPEVILLQAYAQYFSEVSRKETVKENFVKRFGGWKGKIPFVTKFLQKRDEMKSRQLKLKLGKETK